MLGHIVIKVKLTYQTSLLDRHRTQLVGGQRRREEEQDTARVIFSRH